MSASVKSGYKQTEVGIIPGDWEITPLGEVGKWFSGGTPRMSNPAYWDGEHPWVSAKDMKVTRLYDSLDHITRKAVADGARLVPAGTILMVIRGMILAHTFPVARSERPLAFNQDLKAVVTTDAIDSNFLLFWLMGNASFFLGLTTESTHGTKRLPPETLFRIPFPLPTKAEQEAIAAALSDADGLIESLEALIAKKRQIKHGTMQELLTGQKRLPGFSGKWETKQLGECLLSRPAYGINAPAVAYSDNLPTYIRITDITEDGRFHPEPRVSVNSAFASQYYLNQGDLVFARTGASVGKSYLYRIEDGPLVYAGFLIRIQPNPLSLLPEYLSNYVTTQCYWNWVRLMSMRSGQPGINGNEYAQLPIELPPLLEQTAIAAILSDMDAEIAALEAKLAKARQVKQGMMQELLTGRVRLLQPATNTPQSPTAAKAASGKKAGHNRQIEEAVVIGVLAKAFGTKQYPLARKRRVKLTYLLDRHATGKAEGYLKKAAGPYNPATKYKGPEGIAVKNGYVCEHNNGTYPGFVAGEDISKAEAYFQQWYQPDALTWLEQFRYLKTDDLELLATVDMAMQDLRREGQAVDLSSVKAIIRDNPEWKPKLERDIFSDTKITEAITRCNELFADAAGS